MVKFYYFKDEELNNATMYYMDVIKQGIELAGGEVVYTNKLSDISHHDIVVTLSVIGFLEAYFKRPRKLLIWYQGIAPEEILMFIKGNYLYRWLKSIVYSFGEWFSLKKSDYCFFISDSLVQHYRRKYGYNNDNYFIMPCFNEQIRPDAFTDKKYSQPTFLYTGSMDGWQCLPKIIALFKQIKTIIPEATLTMFTGQEVKKILREYEVDAFVTYVKHEELSEAIKDFKYGFLIREDIPINNVATPTKINSYMANGIIPIFTNVIGDFKEILSPLHFSIPVDTNNNGLAKLYELEKESITGREVLEEYQTIFDKYYSSKYYIHSIAKLILANNFL